MRDVKIAINSSIALVDKDYIKLVSLSKGVMERERERLHP